MLCAIIREPLLVCLKLGVTHSIGHTTPVRHRQFAAPMVLGQHGGIALYFQIRGVSLSYCLVLATYGCSMPAPYVLILPWCPVNLN